MACFWLPLLPPPRRAPRAGAERAQLLDLARELAAPELAAEARLALVERMRRMLHANARGAQSA